MVLFMSSKLRCSSSVVISLFVCVLLSSVAPCFLEAWAVRDLPIEKRSSLRAQLCWNNQRSTKSDCKAHVALGEQVQVKCHSTAKTFWPTFDTTDWRKVRGGACLDKPKPKGGGGYEECKNLKSWKELGFEVVSSTNPASDVDWTLTFTKVAEPKIWAKTKIYLYCAAPGDTYAIDVELELLPEPASIYSSITHNFDSSQHDNGKFEYAMEVFVGDRVWITCSKAAQRYPPWREEYCAKPASKAEPCERPQRWIWEKVKYTSRKVNYFPIDDLALSPTHTNEKVVDTYFRCVDSVKDFLFHLKLQPNIPTDRLTRPADSFFADYFAECYQSDGPQPSLPCTQEIQQDMLAYTNCTGLDTLDPPDMNKVNGSFCTEPYKDEKQNCTATKKWSEIFDKPLLQVEERLLVIFNKYGNLKKSTTVYGRCSNSKNGKVLYFKYNFVTQRKAAEGGTGTETPTSGAETLKGSFWVACWGIIVATMVFGRI